MNKFFKTLSFVACFVMVTAVIAYANQVSAAPAATPYNLTMEDTRATVEQKLGQPTVTFAPQAGWESGKPDRGGSPDYIHYWAVYERFNLTVVYNSPSPADKNATIYKIIPHK